MVRDTLIQLGQQSKLFHDILIRILDLTEPLLRLIASSFLFRSKGFHREEGSIDFRALEGEIKFGVIGGRFGTLEIFLALQNLFKLIFGVFFLVLFLGRTSILVRILDLRMLLLL
jgi:hypothetical protein